MPRANLLEELARRPLLCDGAMGTQLIARGLKPGECGELWNVTRPALVQEIHRAYLEAGCDLLTTNTFGACSLALGRHGLADRAAEINRAGAQCAIRAADGKAWVLGDIGPFGDFLEPLGQTTPAELLRMFAAQAGALCEAGVDAFIIETMQDPAELEIAVRAARSLGRRPVIATYAFSESGAGSFRTMMGTGVQEAIGRAIAAGADVVGANCGSLTLDAYVELARQIISAAGSTPVIIQPNAGKPRLTDGELRYEAGPDDFAAIVQLLLQAGVRIVGGCCGTSPEHLRAMAAAARLSA